MYCPLAATVADYSNEAALALNWMAADQSTYAESLKHLGIVRGIERSQAEHVTPSAFYARLKRAEQTAKRSVDAYLQQAELPEPKLRDLVSLAGFVKKVAKAAADPLMKLVKAQQLKIEQLEQKVADREATLDEYRRLYGAFFSIADRPLHQPPKNAS